MNKYLTFTLGAIAALVWSVNLAPVALGQQASFLLLTGGATNIEKYLKPVNSQWGLQWPGLATTTTGCLSVNATGWITPSGSACGAGGGSSAPNVILTGGYLRASSTGLSWLFPDGFVSQSSSTLARFDARFGTTTNATSTSLNVSSELKVGSITGILKGTSGIVSQAINGVDYIGTLFRDWQVSNGSLTPTTTIGITVQAASSTINGLTMNVSTTTSATTTNLSISGGLSFNGVVGSTWASFCTTITGGAGLCDGTDAGGGSGSGNIATSSTETATNIPFYTSTGGSPALLSGGNTNFTFTTASNRLNVTNASSTQITLSGWTVSTTTTVCAVNCEYTSIQGAINDGRNDIVLKDETYAGPVSITRSDFNMKGAGMYQSLITCDAGAAGSGVCVSVATSSRLTRIHLENFGVDNTNATKQGIGLDTSETSNVYASDIRITDFGLGQLTGDNDKQETFYHAYYNMVYFDNNNCFRTASTTNAWAGNLANSHAMYSPRCRIADASTNGVGLDVVGSEGWTFYSPDSEPGTQVGTAMRIDGNSISITVITPWFENNATGTEIKSGALNTKIINGRITGNVVGLVNAGTRTSIDNTLITANTTNISDTSILGTYFNTSSVYNGPFIGYGTSTAISSNTRIATAISSATALDPMVILTNAGAFAAAYSGLMFQNSAGGFPDGIAKIGAEPGSSFTNAVLKFNVADTAKALQERMRITVNGWLGLGTSTPYAKLTVWGGSENTLLEVANSASTTLLRVGLGGATTTGLAATTLVSCDTIDTDGSGNFKCGTDASGGGAGVPDVILTGGYLRASSTGLAWLFPNGFVSQASSSMTDVSIINSTTTNATTTSLNVSSQLKIASITGILKATSGIVAQAVNGVDYIGTLFRDWNVVSGALTPTTTVGIIVNASSTIDRLSVNFGTTTNATSTNLNLTGELKFGGVAGTAWSTFCTSITGGAGLCDGTDATGGSSGDHWATSTDLFGIYPAGGLKVGIGTSTPGFDLQVASSVYSMFVLTDSGAATNRKHGFMSFDDGMFRFGTTSDNSYSSTSTALTLDPVGVPKFGIGTSSPYATLSVVGQTVSSFFTATSATSTFAGIKISNTDCSALTNSGKLTVNSSNEVICSNDVSGGGASSPDVILTGGYLRASSTGLAWLFPNGFVSQASSSMTAFSSIFGTTTNATSTSLNVSSELKIASLSGVLKGTSGIVSTAIDGVDFLGATLFRDWKMLNGALTPTTTVGIMVNASSSIDRLTVNFGTTTNATSTNLNVSGETRLGSITGILKGTSGIVAQAINGVDYIGTLFRDWNVVNGALTPTTTVGIIVNASSTISSLSVANATTTNATTTSLNVTTDFKIASLTGLLKAASGVVSTAIAGVDYINTNFRDWNVSGGSLTPTTTIGITVQASSTISGLQMANSTTTNATTTNSLTLSYLTSKILKTSSTGVIAGAIDGVDFIGPNFRDWSIVNNTLAPTTTIGIVVQASSTISGLTMNTSSTTRATTTIQYIVNDLKLGVDGILASAADGVLTLLGIGNGNDENLTLDFDNATANTVTIASGTGVATTTFSGMSLSMVSASTTATSTFNGIDLTGVNCSGFASGGVVTTNANGELICNDDDTGGGGLSGGSPGAITAWVNTTTVTATSTLYVTAINATTTTATSTFAGAFAVGTTTPSGTLMFSIGTSSPLFAIQNNSGKIGFGCENTSPSRWVFGCGTNANINPNINLLITDPTDARGGACTSDDCLIFKSTAGILGFYGYDYQAAAALDIRMQEFGGKVGISSSTPWATLSVMPQTYSAREPLFVVATSTVASTTIFIIDATSTIAIATTSPTRGINDLEASGARVTIGSILYYGYKQALDHFFLNGRLNTGDWMNNVCDGVYGSLAGYIAADTASVCGNNNWSWQVDSTGASGSVSMATTTQIGQGVMQLQSIPVLGNGGGGLFMGAGTTGWLVAATNTPTMEFNILTALNDTTNGSAALNIGSSTVFVGFTNINPLGGAFETAPTAGCFAVASSTYINIRVGCVTSTTDQKFLNTNISTSSIKMSKIRIEMDQNGATFYTASSSGNLTKLGTIVASYPTTTALIPSAYITHQSATAPRGTNSIGLQYIKIWYRKVMGL